MGGGGWEENEIRPQNHGHYHLNDGRIFKRLACIRGVLIRVVFLSLPRLAFVCVVLALLLLTVVEDFLFSQEMSMTCSPESASSISSSLAK